MTAYWHVAHESYRDGTPLVCRGDQARYGIETPWKWDDADEGTDEALVSLFPDTPDGRREAWWLWSEYPSYVLLRVEVDEGEYMMTFVEEGYPAVQDRIDACDITVVRRGYADGVITPEMRSAR